MSEDAPPEEEQTFKVFQFGGPETEPVFLPNEDANIGDAINTFNEMQEARRTARLPENEEFVGALEEALREGHESFRKVVALQILSEFLREASEALDRLSEDGEIDDETVRESRILKIEDGKAVEDPAFQEKVESWEGDPPDFTKEVAADFMEEADWEETAEWAATHVMYWAARDVNKAYWEAGQNPEDVPEDEWDRRFNEQLTTAEYFQQVMQIIGAEWGEIIAGAVKESTEGQDLSLLQIEELLGLHEDEANAPAPRPETPEWKRSPFQANGGKAAGMPSGPFVLSSTRALATAKGRPAPEGEDNWTRGRGGHPVYVKSFGGNPYDGEVTFTVRASEDATAAEMDASLRWALLDEIGPRVQWAHMYLLAHAADPARRGSRSWMDPINPLDFEHALGLRRSKKKTARQRYQEVKNVVKALTSIYVKTENLKVQGRKVKIRADGVETPLWNLELPTVAEVDMFDGSADVNWYLKAMEGAWADEFLHGREGMPLTWLPKDYFRRRDGRRKFVRRLVPYLIPLFKAAQRQGYRPRLSAEEMLKICGVDLTQKRSSSQRSRLKNQILTALDQLEDVYGIEVHDPNGVRQKYIPWGDWKGRTAYFSPPEEIDGLLLRQEEPKPKLPEVPTENWTSSQIDRLRNEILGGPPEWTQEALGEKLGVTKQYVSQLESGKKNNPSREIRETLTRLYHRHK